MRYVGRGSHIFIWSAQALPFSFLPSSKISSFLLFPTQACFVTLLIMPSHSLANTAFFLSLCVAFSTASSPAAVVRRANDHGSRPAAAVRRHDGGNGRPGPDDGNNPGPGGAVKEIDLHEIKDSFGFGYDFKGGFFEIGRS